jgi:hypothetical protein
VRETSRSKHMGKSVNLAVVSFRFRSSLRMLDQSDGTYIAQVVICRHRSLVAFAVSAAPRTSHKQGRFCAGRSAYRDGRRCVHRREGPRPVYCTSFAQGERHPQTHHVIHPQPSILLAETSVYGAVSTGHCICSRVGVPHKTTWRAPTAYIVFALSIAFFRPPPTLAAIYKSRRSAARSCWRDYGRIGRKGVCQIQLFA